MHQAIQGGAASPLHVPVIGVRDGEMARVDLAQRHDDRLGRLGRPRRRAVRLVSVHQLGAAGRRSKFPAGPRGPAGSGARGASRRRRPRPPRQPQRVLLALARQVEDPADGRAWEKQVLGW